MDNKKSINRFVSHSIKSDFINEMELAKLLSSLPTQELTQFWDKLSSDMAYTNMNRNVPEWQTKNQLNELNYLSLKYRYHSNFDIDSELFRNGFINHIKAHLLEHIKIEMQIKSHFKNQTFWQRMPFYYLLTNLSLIPFAIVNAIFQENGFFHLIIFGYAIVFGLVWILYFLSFFFAKK